MLKKFTPKLLLLFLISQSHFGCTKQNEFLNEKPDANLATITSLSDCQHILNNETLFNQNDIALGQLSCDDYYLTTDNWLNIDVTQENCYIWKKDIFPADIENADWSSAYNQVYNANTVLDALKKISLSSGETPADFNNVKGRALFLRAIAFYNLVQVFALGYDSSLAKLQMGIPLRLSSDLNIKSVRNSLEDSYGQIIQDLTEASGLMSGTVKFPTQPSKAAAFALMARCFLTMGRYEKALQYADSSLSITNNITDYNSITPGEVSIVENGFLDEDIYHTTMYPYDAVYGFLAGVARIDSSLYSSYEDNDLRKSLFFTEIDGVPYFRGTYDYQGNPYSGIATDEVLLIRSESYARLANVHAALADLNSLLTRRYLQGFFIPRTAVDADDALNQILMERRKELVSRGLRWTDLRRLNKDSRFSITLKRVINGVEYTLAPNNPRYALPIPQKEIQLSGIPQNDR